MLVPRVVGFRLEGELPEGATATDLVLTVTEMLRDHGVVGKFVEFYGEGLLSLPLADRATIGNMSPEFGSTCAIFPIDAETLAYLRLTGRSEERSTWSRPTPEAQGLLHDAGARSDLHRHARARSRQVVPTLAGPRRPQDKVPLSQAKAAWAKALPELVATATGQDGRREHAGRSGDPPARTARSPRSSPSRAPRRHGGPHPRASSPAEPLEDGTRSSCRTARW